MSLGRKGNVMGACALKIGVISLFVVVMVFPYTMRAETQTEGIQRVQVSTNSPSMLRRSAIPKTAGFTSAFKDIHAQPLDNDQELVEDLKSRITLVSPPYIFELARRTFDDDPQEALTLFWLAKLRAHIDGHKCMDPTAASGIRHWHKLVPRILAMIQNDPEASQRAKAEAINREEAFLTDSSPRWICFNGQQAAKAAAAKIPYKEWHKPTSQWASIRENARGLMKKSAQ